MNIFAYEGYKDAIRAAVAEKKAVMGTRMSFERLASALGMQKTYLSRILGEGKAHLSQDQLYKAGKFLGLTAEERRFMALLLEWERAEQVDRKAELKAEIEQAARRHAKTESHLKVDATLSLGELADYYLDPDVPLTHMFLAIPAYRADVRQVGQKLGLTPDGLASTLQRLERLGMIHGAEGGYALKRDTAHLPVESPIFKSYRAMQRLKAIERCQKLGPDQAYNFSVVFSADEASRRDIQKLFFDLIKATQTRLGQAKDEDVYQMNFDLFDWSR